MMYSDWIVMIYKKGERFFVIYLDMVLLEGLGHGIFYNIGTNIMVHIKQTMMV